MTNEPNQTTTLKKVIVTSGTKVAIGDTLSEKKGNLEYTGIPQFAPEHFMKISTKPL